MEPSRRGAANACRVVERPLPHPGASRPRLKQADTMMLAEFRGVAFAYPASAERRTRRFAIEELSFDIAAGEIVGVIGPNSPGKRMLILLLTRVCEPVSGEVH